MNADFFKAVEGKGNPTKQPIFIVGMPRSGTTMTEQIIASHPDVYGAGELIKIPNISKTMLSRFPEDLATAHESKIKEMAQAYLDHLYEFAPKDIGHVTDKLPMNFVYLGLIVTLFPNAKIIYCRRDTMDIGLSSFIEMFKSGTQSTLHFYA